jgi:hypothetical protein
MKGLREETSRCEMCHAFCEVGKTGLRTVASPKGFDASRFGGLVSRNALVLTEPSTLNLSRNVLRNEQCS